jgi:hypothetical protein
MLLDVMKDSAEPGEAPIIGYGWHGGRIEGPEALINSSTELFAKRYTAI